MEVIRLSGYTEDEKLNIAKRHLIDLNKLERNGLKANELTIDDSAIIAALFVITPVKRVCAQLRA